jgi:hypothetical protein
MYFIVLENKKEGAGKTWNLAEERRSTYRRSWNRRVKRKFPMNIDKTIRGYPFGT